MKNKIGISMHPWYTMGNLDHLREELDAFERAGADYCELVLHGLDVVVGGRIIPDHLRALRQALAGRPLQYTLHLPYGLNLLDEAATGLYQAVFRAGIELAHACACPVIVYHAGITRRPDIDPAAAEAEILRPMMGDLGGIKVCMENSLYQEGERSCGQTADGMLGMCEAMSHHAFALTFDVGHSFLTHRGDGEALLADIQRLLPHIGHVHLHDNCGIPLPMADQDHGHRIACGAADLHLPLFWGRVPVEAALDALRGFGGIINFETEMRFRGQYQADIRYLREF